MKYTLFLCSALIWAISLSAQKYDYANYQLDTYYAEKGFDRKGLEKSFRKYLNDQGYANKQSNFYQSCYAFVTDYRTKRKRVKDRAACKEFAKLNTFTDFEFRNRLISIMHEAEITDYNDPLQELTERLIAGPVSYQRKMRLLSQAFGEHEFKQPFVQQLVMAFVYADLLVTPYSEHEMHYGETLDKRLDSLMETKGISADSGARIMDELSRKLLNKALPGEINEGYMLLVDCTLSMTQKTQLSDEALSELDNYSLVEIYTAVYKLLPAKDFQKFGFWSAPVNARMTLEALMMAGDISPAIILGGIQLSFDESDMDIPAFRKLYTLLFLAAYRDFCAKL